MFVLYIPGMNGTGTMGNRHLHNGSFTEEEARESPACEMPGGTRLGEATDRQVRKCGLG